MNYYNNHIPVTSAMRDVRDLRLYWT